MGSRDRRVRDDLGITFLSFLTATVTSLFVSADVGEAEAVLQRIEERLAAIESRIGGGA